MTSHDRQLAPLDDRRAGGTLRALAKFAQSEDWSVDEARSLVAGHAAGLPDAIQAYRGSLRPLSVAEPQPGSLHRKVADAFAPIGAKMRPDMSENAAQVWASAIVSAFSDLPEWVAVQALNEAVHIPFDFPTDMERGVRTIADRILLKHRRALRRMELLQEAITDPGRQIADHSPKPGKPLSLEEARAFVQLANLALRTRYTLLDRARADGTIREEDFAIVKAELDAEGQCKPDMENSIASSPQTPYAN